MSGRDFVRLDASEGVPDESGWTDQETLLLLEGGWLSVRQGGGGGWGLSLLPP